MGNLGIENLEFAWPESDGPFPEPEGLPEVTPQSVLPEMMSLLAGISADTGTLRDRFAMAALPGLIGFYHTSLFRETVVKEAFLYADEMLKARGQAVPK